MIIIRPFKSEDIKAVNIIFDEIDAMHRSSRPDFFKSAEEPFRTAEYYARFGTEKDELFVGDLNGEIVGFCEIAIRSTGTVPIMVPRTIGFVDTLAVTGRCRQSGVGAALMEQAEAWSRSKGATAVDFMVWDFNENAIGFYEHRGYSTIMRRMTKPLNKI